MLKELLKKKSTKVAAALLVAGVAFTSNIKPATASPLAYYVAKEGIKIVVSMVGQAFVEEVVKDAYEQYIKGNNYESIRLWSKAIAESASLGSKCADMYFNRGVAYAAEGKYTEAIKDYNSAIALDPNHVQAYNNRGALRAAAGSNDLALRDFNKVIALNPSDGDAYYNRGMVYSDKGDETAQMIEEIMSNPDTEAYADTGSSASTAKKNSGQFSKLKDDQYKQAIADYTTAIKYNPNNARAYYNRSLAYRAAKQIDKANADLAMAKKLDPNIDKAKK